MTNKQLFKILQKTGLPVAYHSWKRKEVPPLPYIVFYQNGDNNFAADNIVYKKNNDYNIELYSEEKDFDSEKLVEDILDTYELYWSKSADIAIPDEGFMEVIYSI